MRIATYLAQQMYNQYKSKFDIDLTQDESTGKSVVTVMQKGTKYAALNKDGKNVFDWEEAVVDFPEAYIRCFYQ